MMFALVIARFKGNLGQIAQVSFKNMMKLPERSEGNFFAFFKANEGYLSQITRK